MKINTSHDAISWMVKHNIRCSGLLVDSIIAAGIDTDDTEALDKVHELEKHVNDVVETTPSIVISLRQALGLQFDDDSRDKEIKSFSKGEALDVLLQYEGILGYTSRILQWIESFDQLKSE